MLSHVSSSEREAPRHTSNRGLLKEAAPVKAHISSRIGSEIGALRE
jgi:hypothetical protein